MRAIKGTRNNRSIANPSAFPSVTKGESILIAFSGLLIFFAWDNSFNMQVIFPVVLILLFLWAKKNPKLDKTALALCVAFLASASVSIALNVVENPEIISSKSITRLIYIIEILIYFYVATVRTYSKQALHAILAGSIVCGLFIALATIANMLHGATGKIAPLTVFGTEVAENGTGALLAFFLALLLLAFRFTRSVGKRAVFVAIGVIMAFGLLLTGSRAAYIAVGLTLAIMLLQLLLSARINPVAKMLIIGLAAVLAFVFVSYAEYILPDFAYNRLFNSNYDDYSNETRLVLWENGLAGFLRQPIFGYGIGNFNYFVTHVLGMTEHVVVVAHNTYLDCLIDVGIVGTLIMAALLARGLRGAFKGGVLVPVFANLAFTALIVGAERTYFLWQALVILTVLARFARTHGAAGLADAFDLSGFSLARMRETRSSKEDGPSRIHRDRTSHAKRRKASHNPYRSELREVIR